MRFSSVLYPALVLAIANLTTPVGAVELIVNGGFENGNFTPTTGHYDTITASGPQDLTGWTVVNSLAWGVNTTDINPHAGIGFVDLTGVGDTIPHGGLDQTISTIIGQQYTFSIFETQDFSSSIVGINVFADSVALALVGTPGLWVDNTGLTAVYGQLTGVFTANSTSTLISIRSIAFGSQVFMIGLDDVSVTGPALNAVPIPGALPLFATGLGALGLLGWRRKRKALVAAS